MKVPSTTICLAGLTGLGIASPLSPRETRARFSIIAARSGSPVHLQPVNANGQAFWIDKPTATYCPPQVSSCPPGDVTVVDFFDGSLSMVCRYSIRLHLLVLSIKDPSELLIFSAQDVSVPGGQLAYVTPTGVFAFTQAHSASIPPGSVQDGFTLSRAPVNGQLASLGFSKLGATGFLACPAGHDSTAPFQVFADVSALKDSDVPGGSVSACIGFDALAVEYKGSGSAAWQYT